MSKFRVGQRVRIVGFDPRTPNRDCADHGWIIGHEGVVNELDCESQNGAKGLIGVTAAGDDDWCFYPTELEPATYYYEKTGWDACVWKPEHLLVGA